MTNRLTEVVDFRSVSVPRHFLEPPKIRREVVVLLRIPGTALLYRQDYAVRKDSPHRTVWQPGPSALSCRLRKGHRLLRFPRDHADLTARTARRALTLRPRNHLTRFDKKHTTDRRSGDGSHKIDRRNAVLRHHLSSSSLPCLLIRKSTFTNLLTNAGRALTKKVSPFPTRTPAIVSPHFTDRRPKNAFPSNLVQRLLRLETDPDKCRLDVVILANVFAQDPETRDAFDRKLLVDLRTTQEEKLMAYHSAAEPRLLDPSTTELSPSFRNRLSLLPLDIPGLQHSFENKRLAQRSYNKTTLTLTVQNIRKVPNDVAQNLAARSEQIHSRSFHKLLVLQTAFGLCVEMRTITFVVFERTKTVDYRNPPTRQD
jgi:hypothetical protein